MFCLEMIEKINREAAEQAARKRNPSGPVKYEIFVGGPNPGDPVFYQYDVAEFVRNFLQNDAIGATITYGFGLWKGHKEDSTVITVVTTNRELINLLIEQLAYHFRQKEIMILESAPHVRFHS